jgi:DNA-binding MarR family transcriptional regulator
VDRSKLISALDRAQQQATSQSVLFSNAVAERLGLSSSDLEALGFLMDEGPAPAGRLSQRTGLTSGAVTRMIDRLERAGYVARESDPTDRRRVIVRVDPDRIQEAVAFFGPMQQAAHDLYARYSDDELRLLLDFLERACEVGLQETRKLQTRSPLATASDRASNQ